MSLQVDISEAKKIWHSAQILDLPPSWNGEPKSVYWLEHFTLSVDPKLDWNLWHLSTDESNLVAAYAIQALSLRDSELLFELPDELLHRTGHISRQQGSFREKLLFTDFVKTMIKSARARKAKKQL